ncbi:MAG: thermonuclease family protein [Propionibacteriales bacterium]|nr:thermonuclease family protein [Propionibacteriales bacterium]
MISRPLARSVVVVSIVAALSGCGSLPSDPAPAPTASLPSRETVVVTSTADGDTFTGRDAGGAKVKVRLLGIDAPETAHNGQTAACGGNAAAARLQQLIKGKTVTLIADARSDSVDKYQRLLRYVEVDGRDVALVLITEGLAEAWYPNSEPRPQRFQIYADAQRSARESRVGSWQTCDKLGR